jgi:hypothetical protein
MSERGLASTSTFFIYASLIHFSVAAHLRLRQNLAMRKPSDTSPNSLSECSICLYPIGVRLYIS